MNPTSFPYWQSVPHADILAPSLIQIHSPPPQKNVCAVLLWPNIMNVSYECSEFITAKSHLINFLWVIKHWRKLMKFACDISSKLTDGRFEHPARSSDNSVIDRMAAVSGGGIWGSEPHQINMGGWENFFVVTQKWDEDSARIKKQSLAYWESRAKVWMNFVWYFPIMIFFRNAPE